MAPPSLVSMSQRACIRNIASLQDVGDISYPLVRPILKRINNPQQLRAIEIASPHIAEHDAELWVAFIARDIPDWREKTVKPKDARGWWKVYEELLEAEKKAREASEARLQAGMAAAAKKSAENEVHYVRKVLPEPIIVYKGIQCKSLKRQAEFVGGARNPNWGLAFGETREPKPSVKNAKAGQIIGALRREAAKARRTRAAAQAIIPSPRSQITQAPASMLGSRAKPNSVATPTQQPLRPNATTGLARSQTTPRREHLALTPATKAEQLRKDIHEAKKSKAPGHTVSSPSTPAKAPPATPTTTRPTTSAAATKGRAKAHPTEASEGRAPSAPSQQPPRLSPISTEGAAGKLTLSPPPPSPVRKRPAAPVSIFMPSKKRRV